MRVKRHYRLYVESKDFWEIFFITFFTERRNRKKVYVLWRITQIWIEKNSVEIIPIKPSRMLVSKSRRNSSSLYIKLVQWFDVTRLSQELSMKTLGMHLPHPSCMTDGHLFLNGLCYQVLHIQKVCICSKADGTIILWDF